MHREVRRLVRLLRRRGADEVLAELGAARGACSMSIVARDLLRVFLRRQLRDRDSTKSGSPRIPRAIEIGAPHRFDLRVQRRRGQQALGRL